VARPHAVRSSPSQAKAAPLCLNLNKNLSHRKFLIPLPTRANLPQRRGNIRSHDRHTPCKPSDRPKEVSKKHHDPIDLNCKADERPFRENQNDADYECRCAFQLLRSREEDDCFVGSDDDKETEKEEDIAHGEEGAVEE